jgi:hypothetical protein
VKSDWLALGQRLNQARQEIQKAEGQLRRHQEGTTRGEAYWKATRQVEVRQAEVTHWEAGQQEYRQQLETLSLTLHPFTIATSTPQTATQVETRLPAHVEAIEAFARALQLPERQAAMTQVKTQLPAMAALVDCWWQGVRQDLAHAAVSPGWQQWAPEVLLPRRYGAPHVTRTRCARRKAKMQQALEQVQAAFHAHLITHSLPSQALEDWQTWATQHVAALQRASSAVEGRTGSRAGLHP